MPTPSHFGSEFLVNTTTQGGQAEPSVTALPNGGYVVVWSDGSATGGDTNSLAVRGQVHSADGSRVGSEFLVNQTAAGAQFDPSVTALEGGGFVVVWFHQQAGTAFDIRARIYNANGTPAGDEFTVDSAVSVSKEPAVAALANGGFVVTWTHAISGADFDIRGRAFGAAGNPLGSEFFVDQTVGSAETQSSVIGLQGGNYLIVWHDAGTGAETDGSGSHIRGAIMSDNGTVVVDEFIVNSTTSDDQTAPTAAVLSDGNIVIAWTHETANGGTDIRGRLFRPDGIPLGPDFLIEGDAEVERFASVTALANGAYAVAWQEISSDSLPDTDTDGSLDHVRARVFVGAGTPISDEFVVNGATNGSQLSVSLATLQDGRLVATWTDTGNNSPDPSGSVRGQIFDPRTQGVLVGGTEGNDHLIGTDLADTLKGFGGNDRLNGAGGNDVLEGGAGGDILNGSSGIDTASYALATGTVLVNLATRDGSFGDAEGDSLSEIENVLGGNFNDLLFGDGKDNVLQGGGGDDLLDGAGNNDVLEGGTGADRLIGGVGIDTISYANSSAGVGFGLTFGGNVGGDAEGDTLPQFDIENVIGSAFNDLIHGSDVINILEGGAGNDGLLGGGAADTLNGGVGNDILFGEAGADVLNGGDGTDTAHYDTSFAAIVLDLKNPSLNTGDAAGDTFISIERFVGTRANDRMEGNAGDNIFDGNEGSDTVNGNEGNDRLSGGFGADKINGGEGTDTADYLGDEGVSVDLAGGTANTASGTDTLTSIERVIGSQKGDTLRGTDTDNVLDGASGDDVVEGFGGNDRLEGGAGNDKLNGGDGADEVIGQSGNDKLDGANGDDLVRGGDGGDAIEGRDGNDKLEGEAGADTIDAGAGNDLLFGGDGNDRLFAAGGTDTLTGGAGNDQFFYTNTAPGQINGDTITDFQSVAGANTGDTLLIHAGFSGIVFNNGSTAITYNGVTETLFHPGVQLSLANDVLVV